MLPAYIMVNKLSLLHIVMNEEVEDREMSRLSESRINVSQSIRWFIRVVHINRNVYKSERLPAIFVKDAKRCSHTKFQVKRSKIDPSYTQWKIYYCGTVVKF